MNTLRKITALLVTIGLLLINTSNVFAVPPLPSSFYGTVKVNGANIDAGTKITAWINGVKYSEYTATLYEGNSIYALDVPGDDTSTSAIEGGVAGDTIVFRIGDLVADQTGLWASGTNPRVNLAAHLNTAPVITEGDSKSVSMPEDGAPTAFSLTLNATDANNDTLTWSISTTASHGTASASGTGTSKAIGYVPSANYAGADSFVVQVSDGNGGTDTITVNVSISAINDAPVITGQATLTTMKEMPLTITLANLNVTDVDNAYPTGFSLTVKSGSNYSLSGSTITPAANFIGTLTVPVTVSDGIDTSAVYNLKVTVTKVNAAPSITEGDSKSVSMSEDDSPNPFSLTLHATDADGDTLTWSIGTTASHGTASASGTGASKVIGYAPNANNSGADSFVVQVSDGNGGTDTITINVTINPVNDAPVITGQKTLTTPEETPLTITLANLDITDVDTLYPIGFSLTVKSGSNYSVSGSTITPAANFVGTLTVPVTVSDGIDTSAVYNLKVTVTKVNVAPVIKEGASISVSMSEDGSPNPFSLTLNASDADNDPITWSISSAASHGDASVSGTGTSKAINYEPDDNYNGSDSFVVQVSDGDSGINTITINVSINAVNDAPVITEGDSTSVRMSRNSTPNAFSLTLHASDIDNDPLTWSISKAALHGTASVVSGTGASKAISYTPVTDYVGADSFIVQVSDGKGRTDTITVNVNIKASNTAPVITEGASTTISMSEDSTPTTFSLTLHAADADNDPLTWSISSAASHGTASVVSGTGTSKAINYEPDDNYNGDDSFVVQVSDGDGGTDTITIDVTVNPTNDAPVITEGASTSVSMSQNSTPNAFSLTLHASDIDNDPLTWSISTAASHGTASVVSGTGASKAISYTPSADYIGADSFVVQVADGNKGTDSIIVNVDIAKSNTAPVITEGASKDVSMSVNGAPVAFELTLHATDANSSDTLTWRISTAASHGTASVVSGAGASKAISYIPSADYIGADSFVVQVADGSGGTDTITVNVNIAAAVIEPIKIYLPMLAKGS